MRMIRSDKAEGRVQQNISCSVSELCELCELYELYELYELCIGICSIYDGWMDV